MRKLGVEEWVVRLVQGMYEYENARSRVRVGEGLSEEFEVNVWCTSGLCAAQSAALHHPA